MSLTSCIDDAHSPVSRFLACELPAVAALAGNYRSRLPLHPDTTRPQGTGPFNYRSLGQAVDLRLRAAFGAPVGSPVVTGIGFTAMHLADFRSPAAAVAVAEVGQELLDQLNAHPPASTGQLLLEQAEEERLARMCFVAAWFEEVFRSGMRPGNPLLHADLSHGLDGVLEEVPDYVPGDIAAQAARADQPEALQWILNTPMADRVCGPTFAGSAHVGGADADFIVAGRLIDCKATIHPKRIGRDQLYQLAGYLLLDYDNTYGIERVGLYLSRQGRLIEWETGQFLRLLGGRGPLSELREACRAALTTAPAEAAPSVPQQVALEQETLFDEA
ncbi:hypothetical protein [Streptomyces asiaticus]|uniref:hypothetical protein n=1 Tax=Streptomyces asiaticus TaxID=114695 RepID=UPI003F677715